MRVEEKGNEGLTDEDSKEIVWRGKSSKRFRLTATR